MTRLHTAQVKASLGLFATLLGAACLTPLARPNAVALELTSEPGIVESELILSPEEPDATGTPDGPLVLSVAPNPETPEPEPVPTPEPITETEVAQPQSTQELNAPDLQLDLGDGSQQILTEEEMRRLANDPLFQGFSQVIQNDAPLPEDVDLDGITAPGAEHFAPSAVSAPSLVDTRATLSPTDAHKLLDETLAIAQIDLSALTISESQRAALQRLDVEIARLWPLWLDSELARNQIGRRDRDWLGEDESRFSLQPSPTLEAPDADWFLAPDEPYYLQVVEPMTNQVYYTKAGDFEQIDQFGSVALLRHGTRYNLAFEPSAIRPSGRAMRLKILPCGRVQGLDAHAQAVVDFNLGDIPLFYFENAARLASEDGVFFVPTPYSGAPQRVDLKLHSKTGVRQHKLCLSNGKPDLVFERIVTLCKSKRRLVEILTQPNFAPETANVGANLTGSLNAAPTPSNTLITPQAQSNAVDSASNVATPGIANPNVTLDGASTILLDTNAPTDATDQTEELSLQLDESFDLGDDEEEIETIPTPPKN
ncbi:MAG: hypothetical protein Q4G03_10015 [Planctomycetia bacterium]|nr:hypothetical protein [Planctomycetia bacterium]